MSLGWITSQETPGLCICTILAFGALLGMPAVFVLCGLLIGFIGAVLYNLSVKWRYK